MINRVGKTESYQIQSKRNIGNQKKGERDFSIDYKDYKEEAQKNLESYHGVEVEFAAEKQVLKPQPLEEIVIEPSFWSELKEQFQKGKKWLFDLWSRIWNGTPEKNDKVLEKEEAADVFSDKRVQDMNFDEVSRYVSDNGSKKLAKNSDLLTTYNQYGKIVEIPPSEKNQIFHGNKVFKEF